MPQFPHLKKGNNWITVPPREAVKMKRDIRHNMLSTCWHKISDGNRGLILAIGVLESDTDLFTEGDSEDKRGLGGGQSKMLDLSPGLQAPVLPCSALHPSSFPGELCSPNWSL